MDQYHYDYMECVCPMDVLLEGGGINSVSLVVNGTVAPQENWQNVQKTGNAQYIEIDVETLKQGKTTGNRFILETKVQKEEQITYLCIIDYPLGVLVSST